MLNFTGHITHLIYVLLPNISNINKDLYPAGGTVAVLVWQLPGGTVKNTADSKVHYYLGGICINMVLNSTWQPNRHDTSIDHVSEIITLTLIDHPKPHLRLLANYE